jgi:hypothetical protein
MLGGRSKSLSPLLVSHTHRRSIPITALLRDGSLDRMAASGEITDSGINSGHGRLERPGQVNVISIPP